MQQRNGRKSLTTVQGLPEAFDYKKILKALKKGERVLLCCWSWCWVCCPAVIARRKCRLARPAPN